MQLYRLMHEKETEDEKGNPLTCPKCGCDLVHDTNNVFNRCLGCGWYGERLK